MLPDFLFCSLFPVQQTTSRIGHRVKYRSIFFGLTTNTLNVRNNNNNNNNNNNLQVVICTFEKLSVVSLALSRWYVHASRPMYMILCVSSWAGLADAYPWLSWPWLPNKTAMPQATPMVKTLTRALRGTPTESLGKQLRQEQNDRDFAVWGLSVAPACSSI